MTRKKMTASEKKAFAERMRKARSAKAKAKAKTTSKKSPRKVARKTISTSNVYVIKIATHNNEIGYLVSYNKTAVYDTDINKALKTDKKAADTIAYMLKTMRPIGIKWVEVVKK